MALGNHPVLSHLVKDGLESLLPRIQLLRPPNALCFVQRAKITPRPACRKVEKIPRRVSGRGGVEVVFFEPFIDGVLVLFGERGGRVQ